MNVEELAPEPDSLGPLAHPRDRDHGALVQGPGEVGLTVAAGLAPRRNRLPGRAQHELLALDVGPVVPALRAHETGAERGARIVLGRPEAEAAHARRHAHGSQTTQACRLE